MLSRKALETVRELLAVSQMPVTSKTSRFWELLAEVEETIELLDKLEEQERLDNTFRKN
jgi:hypothetical protein